MSREKRTPGVIQSHGRPLSLRSPLRLAVAAAALSASLAGAAASGADASCIPMVRYQGAAYFWAGSQFDRDQIAFAGALGNAVIPGCNAILSPGPPPPRPPDRAITAVRVRGIPPTLAVGAPAPAGRGRFLYLRPGFLVTMPAHPLHRAFYRRTDLPDLRTGERCGRPKRLDGRVFGAGPQGVSLQVTGAGPRGAPQVGHTVFLNTDAATVVRLPRWAGLPFIRPGAHIGARARSCDRPGNVRGLVADSLFEAR